MSIPMPVLEDIVGKVESLLMFVVEILKRLWGELDLFAMFPIGATMQDGGKRKVIDVSCFCLLCLWSTIIKDKGK